MFWRLSVPIVKLYNMQLLNWRLVAIDQHTTMVRIWNSHRTRHVNLCFLKRLLNQWITVTAISVWCSITMHRWEGIKQRVVNEVRMPPWFFALPISIECFMKENQGKSTEARVEKRLCTMQPRFKTLENCTWKPLTPEGPMADWESSLGLQTSGSPSIKLQVSFDQEIMTAAMSFFGCMPGGATACRIMKVTYGIQSRHVKELKARRCTERFQTYSNNFFRNH